MLKRGVFVILFILFSSSVFALNFDFNNDNKVDFDDFFLFADQYGKNVDRNNIKFDLDGNNKIDVEDFFIFADSFEKSEEKKSGCFDSDGGKNPNEKGTTKGIVAGGTGYVERKDWCFTENTVRKQYCDEDGKVDFTDFDCENGCEDGACMGIQEAEKFDAFTFEMDRGAVVCVKPDNSRGSCISSIEGNGRCECF